MPPALTQVAQAEATFFYPAITDEELADQDLLYTKYRRSMGMTRIVGLVGMGVAGLWLLDYVRFGPRKRKR
jgi:hypothetical protein